MNQKKNIFKKIKLIYQKEGLQGIKGRIKMRADDYKKVGISGIINKIKGKFLEIMAGRYSLKYAYPDRFFVDNLNDSRPMAEYLAPKIVTALNLRSIIDLGCATGHWVNAFEKAGVDVLGIEGGEHAKAMLVCNPEKVIFADLREPLKIDRKFDMVLSLEVAEHIEHKFVHEYIHNMTRFSPKIIMITAATPGQGGEFHVNEQEEDYWNELFIKENYKRVPQIEKLIAGFVDEAKNEPNPLPIMKHPTIAHAGVHVPEWMPKNLLVYSNDPDVFEYLRKN